MTNQTDEQSVLDAVEETDTLDDVLDVAGEVLREYGDEALTSQTRLCRLARYVVARLGGPPYAPQVVGGLGRATLRDGHAIWRTGDRVMFGTEEHAQWPVGGISAQAVEEFLTGIVRIVELAPTDN